MAGQGCWPGSRNTASPEAAGGRTRVGFVEWPDGLLPQGAQWDEICRRVDAARPDLLITGELPFGTWLAAPDRFDAEDASRAIALHERGIAALAELQAGVVLSSRPVGAQGTLANEAFVLEGGRMRTLHRKHFYPEEEGWREATWFAPGRDGFAVHEVAGLRLGVLLCTELMFPEFARAYGRDGCELIAVPRASGVSHARWAIAGAMAAIVSGAFVISSKRSGRSANSPQFGGRGMAFAPDGTMLLETSATLPLMVVEVHVDVARRQKAEYPCYVAGPEALSALG